MMMMMMMMMMNSMTAHHGFAKKVPVALAALRS